MAGKYVPFFSIQLMHNYCKGNLCSSVQLTPDQATSALMQNLNVVWKQIENVVLFYILTDPLYSNCPLVYPHPTDVFRFSMSVTDVTFFNYTNLCGWGKSNNDLYYLSNQANNVFGSGPENYLSTPIASPNSAVYKKGTLCNLSGNIYEAAQFPSVTVPPIAGDFPVGNSYSFNVNGGTNYPVPGSNEADYLWYNRGSGQSFVSSQDIYQVAGGSYNFSFPAASTLNCTYTSIYGYNASSNAFDIPVTNPPVYQSYGASGLTGCTVNLQGLSSGLYQVNVNGYVQNLFVDNTGQLTGGLGIIEIYATPNGDSDYQLFTGNNLSALTGGSLNNPVYTVQFANNLVYWQYIPAVMPQGATPTLYTIEFGNVSFLNFYGPAFGPGSGDPTSDNLRWGSSLLMIPLVEAIPSTTSPYAPVYPQATGPPTISLPLAQVVSLQQLQDTYPSGSGSGASGFVSQLLVSQNYLNVF